MQADQRKARQFVIERQVPSPIRIVVASFTSLTQLALVRIVLAMAGDASCCELVAVEISGMAGVAFDLDVCTPQRKFGLVMIEMVCLPLALVMTGFAFAAIAAGMNVLQAMTGDAGGRQVLVEFAGMAGRAGDILVGPLQRKFGLAVVERLRLPPFCHRMAVVAALEPALMRIVFLVACKAA